MRRSDPRFTASSFAATPYTTADEKARVVNDTIRFLRANTPLSMFTQRLYKAYSLHFGHIAHFNRHGFHDEWFSSAARRLAFVTLVRDPHPWSFSRDWNDVADALRSWLATSDLLESYELAARRERTSALVTSATGALDAMSADVRHEVLARYGAEGAPAAPPRVEHVDASHAPVQGDLFGTSGRGEGAAA